MVEFTAEQQAWKILVVDDVRSARKIIQRLLQKLGFTDIVEAASGEEALARIKEGGVKVIICDWVMPGMDGLDVLRSLFESFPDQQFAFLMITANREKAEMKQAISCGVQDYIMKPFSMEALANKISGLLKDIPSGA
jgi:two-component system, chemotaxis family, chemotaxis protein CheY